MSDRLDRLEELTAQNAIQIAQMVADTAEQKRIQAQRDAEMAEWRRANEVRFTEVTDLQRANETAIAQLIADTAEQRRIQAQQSMEMAEWRLRHEAQMTRHEQTFEEIGRMFADLYVQMGESGSRFEAMATQILGLQTENRRILGILEGRQDNGHEPLA